MEQTEYLSFDDDIEDETLDDDVDMPDASLIEEIVKSEVRHNMRDNVMLGPKKKKNKKKKKKKSSSNTNITDINRFVINTCKRFKEGKSYLIWNAVGCLGVSAMMDLVKEVDTIQHCGGQKTADGKRFRTGGGVLWNILKTREPKAYKEIMAKSKEFEKQLRQPQTKQRSGKNVVASQVQNVSHGASECLVSEFSNNLTSLQNQETSESLKGRSSVRDRIRVPVTYDDLLEEGEIYEP